MQEENLQPQEQEPEKKESKPSMASDLFYWAEALVFALTILVVMSVFFVRLSAVDGSSMLPTLEHQDRLLVSIWNKNNIDYGDIVVVMAPKFEEEPLVKRVVALPGDIIDIEPVTGQVSLNGEQVFEPYINEMIADRGNGHVYPYTVPENCYFVMGDNRNHSADSRVEDIGAIPKEHVIGKVFFRIFPFNHIGKVQ